MQGNSGNYYCEAALGVLLQKCFKEDRASRQIDAVDIVNY